MEQATWPCQDFGKEGGIAQGLWALCMQAVSVVKIWGGGETGLPTKEGLIQDQLQQNPEP